MIAPPDVAKLSAQPASPCVRKCCLDTENDVCIGCFRALTEITGWQAATAAEKEAILNRAKQRRADYAKRFPARNSWQN